MKQEDICYHRIKYYKNNCFYDEILNGIKILKLIEVENDDNKKSECLYNHFIEYLEELRKKDIFKAIRSNDINRIKELDDFIIPTPSVIELSCMIATETNNYDIINYLIENKHIFVTRKSFIIACESNDITLLTILLRCKIGYNIIDDINNGDLLVNKEILNIFHQ